MKFGRQLVILTAACLLLGSVACTKKPPQLPPQAKAPAEPIPTPLPVEISEEAPPPPPPAPKIETPPPEPPKPKPATHKRKKTTPPAATQAATGNSPAATASNNTTTIAAAHPPGNPAGETPPDTAIAADVSNATLRHQKQTTAQLLDETDKVVTGLNRSLSHDEEEMVAQIRSYVAQSRKATSDGDFERAYNLATKAHLLSDALVKK